MRYHNHMANQKYSQKTLDNRYGEKSVMKDYSEIASTASFDQRMYPQGGIKKTDLTREFVLQPPIYLAKNTPITINRNKLMNYNSTLELARARFENSLERDEQYN